LMMEHIYAIFIWNPINTRKNKNISKNKKFPKKRHVRPFWKVEKTRVRTVHTKVSVMGIVNYIINITNKNRIFIFVVFECENGMTWFQNRKNWKKRFEKGIKNPIFGPTLNVLDDGGFSGVFWPKIDAFFMEMQ